MTPSLDSWHVEITEIWFLYFARLPLDIFFSLSAKKNFLSAYFCTCCSVAYFRRIHPDWASLERLRLDSMPALVLKQTFDKSARTLKTRQPLHVEASRLCSYWLYLHLWGCAAHGFIHLKHVCSHTSINLFFLSRGKKKQKKTRASQQTEAFNL